MPRLWEIKNKSTETVSWGLNFKQTLKTAIANKLHANDILIGRSMPSEVEYQKVLASITEPFDPCKHCHCDFSGNAPCDNGMICEYMPVYGGDHE